MMPRTSVTLARLSDIAPDTILAHMTDPRIAAHLPLLAGRWDRAAVAAFVAAKESRWQRDGLGHWAFLRDGDYLGWGGFEREGEEWDFGLVLRPEHFGQGPRIARQLLRLARTELGIARVTFLLAPTRRHLRGLERIGAIRIGPVEHAGERFIKYQLDTGGAGVGPGRLDPRTPA
ncbi:MAG: GNAT family N-acetyltransferase [Alphaproteobacteria bacterium]|nr:MAG: GNAT family N-acetyltransferase [Alphaproteobacteria bacterium]